MPSQAITRYIRTSMFPETTLFSAYATEHDYPPIAKSAGTVNKDRLK